MKNTLQFILLLTIIPQILTAQIDTFFSMSHTKAHFIKDDTIWMVSDGGVVKRTCSTGTILATYTPANSPIPYHSATGIWVDLQHRMWLYLEEKGIAMLDGNQWTTWDVEDAHYVLAGGYNGKVAVDNDGVAWIAAPYRTPMQYKNGHWQEAPNPTFANIDSRSMKIGPDGKLWVVSGYGGIFRHTGTKWEQLAPTLAGVVDFAISAAGDFYTCTSENGTTTLYRALSGSTDLVPVSNLAGDAQRMAVSPSGRVWVAGKFAEGIAFYENGQWQYLSEGESFPGDWYHIGLSVDGAGRLWDTKAFYGTKVHDGTSWQRIWNGPIGFQYGTTDQDGSIWFGYLNTLSKYTLATGETTYKYLSGQQLFEHNNIMAMEQGPNGTFYAASQRGPIHWYDGNGNFQTAYEQTGATGAWDAYVKMKVDQSDNLYYQGVDAFSDLIQYNAKTNKYVHITQYHNNTPTIPFSDFYHFETDGLDRLWLYTDKGLTYWKNGAWKTFFEPGPAPDAIEYMKGGAGGVWICSPSVQTVYYFDGVHTSSWNLPVESNAGEQIFKLFTDSRNWLWCITNQSRVLCFTGYTWKVYDADLGTFPAYSINTLFEDQEGNIWFLNGDDIAIRLTIPTGRLSGQLIDDLNLDCTIQPDEQGIRGYKIVLDNGQQKVETIPDKNGRFAVHLSPGNYTMFINSLNNLGESCQSGIPVVVVQGEQQQFQIPVKTILHTPIMSVKLSTAFTRRCWETTYTVQVCNDGNIATDSAFVSLELPAGLSLASATAPYIVDTSGLIVFRAGKVDPGFCNYFSFTALVGCDNSVVLGQSLCVTAHVSPDTLPTSGISGWTGASLTVHGRCAGNKVIFEVKNEGNSPTLSPMPYEIIKDEFLHESGVLSLISHQIRSFEQEADGSTWRFSMSQEPGHPFAQPPSLAVEGCVASGSSAERSSGFVTQAANSTGSSFDFTDCHDVVGSFDPNAKECQPKGWGEQHHIRPEQLLRYQIHFQNTGTDTAFTVIVRDTLSTSLDWNSFRTEIASHPFRVEKDSVRRGIAFIFEPIMLPDSNRNEPASHGFIQFAVRPKPSVPLGTTIFNSASIYFDFNDPVLTNTVQHTIDTGFIRLKPVPPNYETLSALAFAPNPATNGTWIALDYFDKEESYRMELFDIKGRQVRSAGMSQSPFWLERKALPSGVYQASVLLNGKRIATGQLVFD